MSIAKFKEQIAASSINEVAKVALQKARDVQPLLNSMVTFCEVEDSHLEQADQTSCLYGIPIVLKDNVSTKGIRTTASSRILDTYVPVYNATIVEKLQKAGAVLIGKSSMDELGMGGTNKTAYTGPVHNPYSLDCISGGSSGGSAVLVASGVVPFAIGTDTGDSVRKPASYCNIVGVKPTYGRISRYGIIPYASSLDHVGYFTTTVEDAASVLGVLAGRDDKDMTSSAEPVPNYHALLNEDLHGKKIAILDNVTREIRDTVVLEQFASLVEQLVQKGAIVEKVHLNESYMKALVPVYFVIANAEASANHSNLDGIRFGVQEDGASVEEVMMNSRTKGFSSFIRKRFVIGSYALFIGNQEKVLRKAQRVRRLIVNEVEKVLEAYDVILSLASGSGAPKIQTQEDADHLSNEYLIAENHMVLGNFSGFPSMTLPMGFDEDNMPVGVNLLARAFAEVEMFGVALAIEEVVGLKDMVKEVLI